MSLLDIQHAGFQYDGNTVLKDITFSVEEKQYLCIVGVNGSGKSTLIRGILGLKKPSEGSVAYGEGLSGSQIGYLPQQTDAQKDFPASVYEVVLSGRLNKLGRRPFYRKEDRQAADEKIELLNIGSIRNKSYQKLSGGQQQRVLLARALCAADRLIVLDEPVSGLDPAAAADFYRICRQINEGGMTIIMVSHDIQSALSQASHILYLGHSEPFFGTVEEFKNSPAGKKYLSEAAL
ncbi:MAG: metal ABC transporter ATP-binding protein [Solobacterium sp.]|nr:metal ABC transporter ATP-binding protein [Solobacterium sp.]